MNSIIPPETLQETTKQELPHFQDLHQLCFSHMQSHGIEPPDYLKTTTEIERYSGDGKKGKDEWYWAVEWEYNGRSYLRCTYGSWSIPDSTQYFKSWNENTLSSEEQAELKREIKKQDKAYEEAIKKAHKEAAVKAKKRWKEAQREPSCKGHTAYIEKKGIKPYGLRYTKNEQGFDSCVYPLYGIHGVIVSLQFISVGSDGTVYKSFLDGGEKKGCFSVIGDLKKSTKFFVCEGFATGASVYEATGIPVVVALDCNNLDPVISNLRKKYRDHEIVITGDDDSGTEEKKGFNPGKQAANQAAESHGCGVVFPSFLDGFRLPNGERATDFNDLHAHFGLETIKEQLSDQWTKQPTIPLKGAESIFDISILHEDFRRMLEGMNEHIKSPQDMNLHFCLGAISTAVGKTAVIVEIVGLEHFSAQGNITVGEQGERKSDSFKKPFKEINEYEIRKKLEYKKQVKEIHARNRSIEAQIRLIKNKEDANKIIELELQKQEIPPEPRLYSTDTTEQKLIDLMEERGGEYAIAAGEGRGTVNQILGKYSLNGEANDSVYLSAISGDKISKDRATPKANGERNETVIHDPCLNVTISIQPDKFKKMASNEGLKESGFLSRFFITFPESNIGYRPIADTSKPAPPLDEVKVAPFHGRIRALLDFKDKVRELRKSVPSYCHKVTLSQDAMKARNELYNRLELGSRPGAEFSENNVIRGLASKHTSKVVKIALALHMFEKIYHINPINGEDGPDSTSVSLETWNRAERLGWHLLYETLKAFGVSKKIEMTTKEKLARRLYDCHVAGKPLTTIRDISRYFKPVLSTGDLKKTLKELEDHRIARLSKSGQVELHPHFIKYGIACLKGQVDIEG